ncbi:MAG TPA: hypothetical protein VMT32_14540 [Bryobacteraceae bacterium]|nr:hypothetical protein [Bryobacteraceae bacterium]
MSPFCAQIQQCVSSSRGGSGIRFPTLAGGENVTQDADCSFQPAKNDRPFIIDRDKAGNRLTALGDYDFLALLLDFIQQTEALGFKDAGGYSLLLHDYVQITIVISDFLVDSAPRSLREMFRSLWSRLG